MKGSWVLGVSADSWVTWSCPPGQEGAGPRPAGPWLRWEVAGAAARSSVLCMAPFPPRWGPQHSLWFGSRAPDLSTLAVAIGIALVKDQGRVSDRRGLLFTGVPGWHKQCRGLWTRFSSSAQGAGRAPGAEVAAPFHGAAKGGQSAPWCSFRRVWLRARGGGHAVLEGHCRVLSTRCLF